MSKFKILNKKGFGKDKIKRDQCLVKGKPHAAGDVVTLDAASEDAKDLVFGGLAMPEGKLSKDGDRLYGKWKGPEYTDAPVGGAVAEKK